MLPPNTYSAIPVVDAVTNPNANWDVMGYDYPQFYSDYFFAKTSLWANSVNPPPTVSSAIKAQERPLKHMVNKPQEYILILHGSFKNSNFEEPTLYRVSRYPYPMKPVEDSEWKIQLMHRNRSIRTCAAWEARAGSGVFWNSDVPDDDWVSYRLLRNGVDMGGEVFGDYPAQASARSEDNSTDELVSLQGDILRWNLPQKPTHGFSLLIKDENGKILHPHYSPEYGLGMVQLRKDVLERVPAPRIYLQASYGLTVIEYVFPLVQNRAWTAKELESFTQKEKQ